MSTLIRKGSPEDSPALVTAFQAAVRVTNRQDYTSEQVEVWANRGSEARFRELFGEGLSFFIAESGSVCAGFASVSREGLLHSLFVAPKFQRQGVASLLVNEILRFAAENSVESLVSDVSITALPFFLKQGFAVIREQDVRLGTVVFKNYRMKRDL